MSKTIAGLKVVSIKPGEACRNPWNPNRMNEETFQKEILSIKTHGFIDPIKVRENPSGEEFEDEDGNTYWFQIVDGEHRWRASTHLGLKEIPAINLGPISDEQAKKLTIIANELRGAPEPVLLAALLKDLSESVSIENLSAELPFTQLEIDSLIKSTQEFNWDAVEESLTVPASGPNGAPTPSTPPPAFGVGQERKVQIGVMKGSIPARLADQLMLEFDRSAAAIGTKTPELVLRHWLERLQASATSTDEQIKAQVANAPPPPAAKKRGKKKEIEA